MLNVTEEEYKLHQNEEVKEVMKFGMIACHMTLMEKQEKLDESMGNPSCKAMPFLFYTCVKMAINRVSFKDIIFVVFFIKDLFLEPSAVNMGK